MGLVAFSGYVLLGAGPGLVVAAVVGRKPLLLLYSMSSATFWLLTLVLAAAPWRGVVPLEADAATWAWPVLLAVLLQEAARVGVGRVHRRGLHMLERQARALGYARLTAVDQLSLSLAAGLGHGAAHSLVFFLSVAPLALTPATHYSEQCPQMSLYLVAALCSLAFLLLHTFGAVVALAQHEPKHAWRRAFVPALHLLAGLLTLGNFTDGGCTVVVPALLVCAGASLGLCAKVCMEQLDVELSES